MKNVTYLNNMHDTYIEINKWKILHALNENVTYFAACATL